MDAGVMDASYSSAIGSCHFMCSADLTQSLENVVLKLFLSQPPSLVLFGTTWSLPMGFSCTLFEVVA